MTADRDALTIRNALSEVETLSTERRRFLAGFAYILVRLARADGELDSAETARIESEVAEVGGVSEQQGALVVAVASGMGSLFGTTEDFSITRDFARSSAPQERQRLLRSCIAIALANGAISGAQRAELYEIGHELGFKGDEIDAVCEQLERHRSRSNDESG